MYFASANMAKDEKSNHQALPPGGKAPGPATDDTASGTPSVTPATSISRPQSLTESTTPSSESSNIRASLIGTFRRSGDLSEEVVDTTTNLQDDFNVTQPYRNTDSKKPSEQSPRIGDYMESTLGLGLRKDQNISAVAPETDVQEDVATNPEFILYQAYSAADRREGGSDNDEGEAPSAPNWSPQVLHLSADQVADSGKRGVPREIFSNVIERTEHDVLSDRGHVSNISSEQSRIQTIADVMAGRSGSSSDPGSMHEEQGDTANSLFKGSIHNEQDSQTISDIEGSIAMEPIWSQSENGQSLEFDPSRPIPVGFRGNYTHHTRASLAKQTEKVPSGPSRRMSRSSTKEPPHQSTPMKRSKSIVGNNRIRQSSLQIQRSDNDVRRLAAIHRSVPSTPSIYYPHGQSENVRQGPSVEHKFAEVFKLPYRRASLYPESDEVACNETSLDFELAQDSDEPDTPESGVKQATEHESVGSRNFEENGRSEGKYLHAVCDHWYKLVKEESKKFYQEAEWLKVKLADMQQVRDDVLAQLEMVQQKVPIAQDSEPRGPDEANEGSQALQNQITILEGRIVELNQKLQEKSEDLKVATLYAEQAKEAARESDVYVKKLGREVEKLTNDINDILQNDSDRTPDVATLRTLIERSDFDREATKLHSDLLQHTPILENGTRTNSLVQDEALQHFSNKKHGLAMAVNGLQAKTAASKNSMAGVEQPWETNQVPFEKLYYHEKRQRKHVEEREAKFRETAGKWYQPDLERKNRDLQIDLNMTKDENAKFREKLKKQQALVEMWELEYNISQAEMQKRTTSLEDEVQEQKTEMLVYIKEYHDKTKDPGHWKIPDLQKTVRSLERALHTTNAMFNTTKTDKARLEDEMTKVLNINARYEREIERLGKAWITGSIAPPISALDSDTDPEEDDDDDDPSGLTSPRKSQLIRPTRAPHKGPYIPRCHLPAAIKKRTDEIRVFTDAQKQRHKAEKQEADLVERVRAWKMEERAKAMGKGALYPPKKKGWDVLVEKGVWKRWDGEEWLVVEGTEEDDGIVEGMRRKEVGGVRQRYRPVE